MLKEKKLNKDQLIDALLSYHHYKMPDGRQFYEATESELLQLICKETDNQFTSCHI
ncbi:Fur-regulated basic protein FbpA [Halalkalibacter oceani]|uniref:Fur-regulated basic protein FbpA n=1 Tax=Halalkalibacter oceani TaxID=1653776 RepID=A0A9X2DSX3_9BACI|nr:Fur-regulated basic protein FbpA [Halalkalibacter oceani]MCM3716439.1 Fur-regulated basic protein FbpA [Halalkalibacter oceani]MCM3760958.1 Fur-regulated basic protein FbpA [Halalkalibacter oceani]